MKTAKLEVAAMHQSPLSGSTRAHTPLDTTRLQDERVFQAIFLVSFPLFLAAALAGRVLPMAKAAGADRPGKQGSVFVQASATARSTIAIALTN